METEIIINRKTKAEIEKLPVNDGNIYFSTDSNEIFMDNEKSRKSYGSNKQEIDDLKNEVKKNKEDVLLIEQNCSNTIRKRLFGKNIFCKDVSPIKHLVKCIVHGKNLAYDKENIYPDGSGVVGKNLDMYSVIVPFYYKNEYTVTAIDGGFMRIGFSKEYPTFKTQLINISNTNDRTKYYIDYKEGETHISQNNLLEEANYMIVCYCRRSQSINTPEECFNYLQVEIGNEATLYEPAINPTETIIIRKDYQGKEETYIPNSKGFVEKMYSVPDTMTILSNNEKAILDIEYNVDIRNIEKRLKNVENLVVSKTKLFKKIDAIIIPDKDKIKLTHSSYWNAWIYDIESDKEYSINTPIDRFENSPRIFFATLNIPSYSIDIGDITSNIVNHSKIISDNNFIGYSHYNFKSKSNEKSMIIISTKSKTTYIDEPIINEDKFLTLSYETMLKNNGIIKEGSTVFTSGKIAPLHCEINNNNNKYKNIIVTIVSKSKKSIDGNFPSIYAQYDIKYRSTKYSMDNLEYETHQFRLPAFRNANNNFTLWAFVPKGCELEIKDINISYSNLRVPYQNGIRLSAHLGFYSYAPENTISSYKIASESGYPSCICNPKITKDGIFVCAHDSDIRREARNLDGSKIVEPVIIEETNYNDLLNYDFGIAFSDAYKGEKIPKLEDFFKICAKTNMQPIWSVHHNFTIEQYRELKFMLKKYGLLKTFTIKGILSVLERAYDVFGDEIKGYTYDVLNNTPDIYIRELQNSKLKNSKTVITIEFCKKSNFTEETCKKVINSGYKVGVFDVLASEGSEYNKWISWGVTEITDDSNCSFGLNW